MQQESKLISATELQLHVPVCRVLARTHRSAARCALVTSSHVFTWPGNKTMIQQYQQRKCTHITINLQHLLDRLRGIQRECMCNVLCSFIPQMVMSQPGINHIIGLHAMPYPSVECYHTLLTGSLQMFPSLKKSQPALGVACQ